MTDKERLEEIKEIDQEVSNGFALEDLDLNTMTVVNREHFNWLIEQAERVQELEKENKRLEDFIETIQNVHFVELQREKAENRRYRKALEEIARGRFPGASYKARKALEGEE